MHTRSRVVEAARWGRAAADRRRQGRALWAGQHLQAFCCTALLIFSPHPPPTLTRLPDQHQLPGERAAPPRVPERRRDHLLHRAQPRAVPLPYPGMLQGASCFARDLPGQGKQQLQLQLCVRFARCTAGAHSFVLLSAPTLTFLTTQQPPLSPAVPAVHRRPDSRAGIPC